MHEYPSPPREFSDCQLSRHCGRQLPHRGRTAYVNTVDASTSMKGNSGTGAAVLGCALVYSFRASATPPSAPPPHRYPNFLPHSAAETAGSRVIQRCTPTMSTQHLAGCSVAVADNPDLTRALCEAKRELIRQLEHQKSAREPMNNRWLRNATIRRRRGRQKSPKQPRS